MEQQEKLEQIVPERSTRFSLDPWKFSRHFRPFLEEKNCPPAVIPYQKGGSWCQKSDWKVKGLTGVTRDARVTMASKEGERGGEDEGGGDEGKEGLGEGKEQTRKDRATQPIDHGRLRWAKNVIVVVFQDSDFANAVRLKCNFYYLHCVRAERDSVQ